MSAGLVCGFWDEPSELAGVGWSLGGSSGGLLLLGEDVEPATAELGGTEAVDLTLRTASDQAAAALRPAAPGEPAASANGDGVESVACDAEVDLGARTVSCSGFVTRWAGDPLRGAGVLRHLALTAPDGGVLVVLSHAQADAPEWGGEDSSAWVLGPAGVAGSYPDAWLSTQYDGEGRQTRAGLELWGGGEDSPPMRAAGTLLGDSPEPSGGVSAAILRTSAEGASGLGSYLIWRG